MREIECVCGIIMEQICVTYTVRELKQESRPHISLSWECYNKKKILILFSFLNISQGTIKQNKHLKCLILSVTRQKGKLQSLLSWHQNMPLTT